MPSVMFKPPAEFSVENILMLPPFNSKEVELSPFIATKLLIIKFNVPFPDIFNFAPSRKNIIPPFSFVDESTKLEVPSNSNLTSQLLSIINGVNFPVDAKVKESIYNEAGLETMILLSIAVPFNLKLV